MPEAELRAEIAAGVNFWAYETEAGLVGVMGRQDLEDVTLIRHAYVDPAAQRQGVGARLLTHLLQEIPGPVLVGTWAAAWWAIRFYEKHDFRAGHPDGESTACSAPTGPFRPARWKPRWSWRNYKWFASEGSPRIIGEDCRPNKFTWPTGP